MHYPFHTYGTVAWCIIQGFMAGVVAIELGHDIQWDSFTTVTVDGITYIPNDDYLSSDDRLDQKMKESEQFRRFWREVCRTEVYGMYKSEGYEVENLSFKTLVQFMAHAFMHTSVLHEVTGNVVQNMTSPFLYASQIYPKNIEWPTDSNGFPQFQGTRDNVLHNLTIILSTNWKGQMNVLDWLNWASVNVRVYEKPVLTMHKQLLSLSAVINSNPNLPWQLDPAVWEICASV